MIVDALDTTVGIGVGATELGVTGISVGVGVGATVGDGKGMAVGVWIGGISGRESGSWEQACRKSIDKKMRIAMPATEFG